MCRFCILPPLFSTDNYGLDIFVDGYLWNISSKLSLIIQALSVQQYFCVCNFIPFLMSPGDHVFEPINITGIILVEGHILNI